MTGHSIILITTEEAKAIRCLKRLAKKWPQSIGILSHAGSLVVTKTNSLGIRATVSFVEGIPNDGGDPSADELDQHAQIEWPSQ
jgi:hypothetical protein